MTRVNGFDRHYAEAAFLLSTSDSEAAAGSPPAAATAYIEQSVNRALLLVLVGYIACVVTIGALGMLLFLLIG